MEAAFLQGLLGSSSLLLGALLGIVWQPRRSLAAAILAFGSGTLIAAIAFEIALNALQSSGFWPVGIGFFLGGILFVGITRYVDRQGGFLRKPASQRRHLFQYRQEAVSEVLGRMGDVELLRRLPPHELQAIAPLLKPLRVAANTVLCQEGAPGDSLYIILAGEAEVRKGEQIMATLGPGEVIGEMALLTGEPRSATVIAHSAMDLYQLRQQDFQRLLGFSPHLVGTLSRTLAHRLQATTESRAQAERERDRWQRQVLESIELDLPQGEERLLLQQLAKNSAPFAILIGTLIDNIPESAVIGITAQQDFLGGSFLLAVFISNFPEALSSTVGMKQTGTSPRRILSLWSGVVILSGVCALLGNLFASQTSGVVIGIAQAISGGAILAMLTSTMMPQAYELGGATVAFSTIAGFLMGLWVSFPQV